MDDFPFFQMVGPGNHEANCDNGTLPSRVCPKRCHCRLLTFPPLILTPPPTLLGGYKNYTESICPMGQTNFTGFINHWR